MQCRGMLRKDPMTYLKGEDDDLPTFLRSYRLRLLPSQKRAGNEVIFSLQEFLSCEIDGGLTSKRAILGSSILSHSISVPKGRKLEPQNTAHVTISQPDILVRVLIFAQIISPPKPPVPSPSLFSCVFFPKESCNSQK